jgi:hypothetical protein
LSLLIGCVQKIDTDKAGTVIPVNIETMLDKMHYSKLCDIHKS